MPGKKSATAPVPAPASGAGLLMEVRDLILTAREETARAVNSGLTLLYWEIGDRIRREVLREKRAECGKQIVHALSGQSEAGLRRKFWTNQPLPHDAVHGGLSRTGDCERTAFIIRMATFQNGTHHTTATKPKLRRVSPRMGPSFGRKLKIRSLVLPALSFAWRPRPHRPVKYPEPTKPMNTRFTLLIPAAAFLFSGAGPLAPGNGIGGPPTLIKGNSGAFLASTGNGGPPSVTINSGEERGDGVHIGGPPGITVEHSSSFRL